MLAHSDSQPLPSLEESQDEHSCWLPHSADLHYSPILSSVQERVELFVMGESVRPGILVLVNGTCGN